MFFCIYCGVEREESKRSVEHPLPRVIGGHGWSIPDVCVECNRYCGREVDYPFASHPLTRQLRHRFEIPDARGRVPSAPRLYGETSGGVRVELELGHDRPRIRRLPHRLFADPSGERYLVEPGEGDRFLSKRIERLRRQAAPGYEVRTRRETVDLSDDRDALIPVSISTELWPRLGAKLGLAFGSRALGPEWAHSQWASWLRARLRGEAVDPPDPRLGLPVLPEPLSADDPLALLADPPNHTVFLAGAESVALIVHLFGLRRYVVPLGSGKLSEPPSWVFDPHRGHASQMPFGELVLSNSHRPAS